MSQYTDLIATDGYVALWKLDDNAASTTIVRTGSVGGNGTLYNGGNTSTKSEAVAPAGIGGNSLHLDGTNDYIEIADDSNYTAFTTHPMFTAEIWFRADTAHHGMQFDKGPEWALQCDVSGAVVVGHANIAKTDYNQIKYSSASVTSALNTWIHHALTWDRAAGVMKHYINGVDQTNLTSNNAVTGDGDTTSPLRLGNRNYDNLKFFDGYLSHAAIYHTVLTPTQILKHYEVGAGISTYIDAGTTQTIAFTAPAPTVSVEGTVNVTADLATVSFSAFAPTISIGIDISAPAAEVIFTALAPTVKAYTSFTEYSFEGSLASWHSTPSNSSGANYTTEFFGAYNNNSSTGSKSNAINITTPSNVINISIVIDWEYKENASGSANRYILSWNAGDDSYWNSGTSQTVTKQNTYTSLSAATVYPLWTTLYTTTSVYPSSENVRVTKLTLNYEAVVVLTEISVDNIPEVAFTKLDPTVTSGQQTILTVDNVPAVTAAAFDPDVLTPGQVYIGTTTSIVSYIGLDPTLSTTQSVEQVVTSPSVLEYGTYDATVDPDYTALSFKFIIKSCPCRTAADSNAVTSIDLGSGLFNQEKEFAFKLGNTSSSVSTFTISATSINNLADMVTFSIDKYGTYSSTLTIQSVQPNRITDVIWGKLTIDTDAIVDDGTFLIHVEQTHA